ncbi:MAG TPA: DUF4386 domain-containing protein [Terracidiphilus sp.]|jgi:hypothetical protein
MTLRANARLAGFTFLLYIAAGITIMVVSGTVFTGHGAAEKLASAARAAVPMRSIVLMGLVTVACAVVLAVTLYRITRDVDEDLARMAMVCRVMEGVFGALGVVATVGLIWLATAAMPNKPGGLDGSTSSGLAQLFFEVQGLNLAAIFFSVGSLLFSYLLLRGRMIPAALAWIGVIASLLLVVALPLQLVGVVRDAMVGFLWMPMLAFEVPLGFWLMVKGVRMPEAMRV